MNPYFINQVSTLTKISRMEQIEKDFVLHQILADLSRDEIFADNFLFKGGTCLIKYYLGYYRFSEDLDFTWRKQEEFVGKTTSWIVRYLEDVLERTGKMLEDIVARQNLDFKWDKGNRNYVELNNGGRITTFHIRYNSAILNRDVDLKVQINFVEDLCMKPQHGALRGLIGNEHKDLEGVFDEYDQYSSSIPFRLYDVKEIMSEKIRALLTRRGTKARDFLDVYMISEEFGIDVEDIEGCVIKKIDFALQRYERFRNNFAQKRMLVEQGNIFEWGGEKDLLVTEIDEKKFNGFVDQFTIYLQRLVKLVNTE